MDYILNESNYNDVLREYAVIMNNTYKNKNDRPNISIVNNKKFFYKKNKSNNLYSHYENENDIIVSFHGVSNLKELGIGIKRILKPNFESSHFKSACIKYNKVIDTKKNLIMLGHSLGTQMISWCYNNNPKREIVAILFSPYIFDRKDKINRKIIEKTSWKKILVETDYIGNKILKDKKRKNTIIFKIPFLRQLKISKIYGHSMKSYIDKNFYKKLKQKN